MALDAKPFWDWMTERHSIYLRRKAGMKAPWTLDPVLSEYSFCNVYRELDRVTIWIRENWREPHANSPYLWIAMCLARQINWPDTLNEIGFPIAGYSPKHTQDVLEARQARGEKVYTGAYMISAPNKEMKALGYVKKPAYTAQIVVGQPWASRAEFEAMFANKQPTMQEVHTWLKGFIGYGDFMAYEVVTDLRHTRYLCNAPDINTWAVAGPGAIRGLNRLHGRDYKAGMSQEQALAEMLELLALSKTCLPDWMPPLELREIEHSLCETDKWLRVKLGQGTPRAKFHQPATSVTIFD